MPQNGSYGGYAHPCVISKIKMVAEELSEICSPFHTTVTNFVTLLTVWSMISG
jgi:hypothetical protein